MEADKLGVFIAQRRKELGLTQAALAEKIHVTDKAVSRWERGIGLPDISNMEALADALELSLVELIQTKKKDGENITAEEAEKIVIDTIELSKPNREERPIKLLGRMNLCGFAFLTIVLLLIIICSKDGMAYGSVWSILLGLLSWMVPIWFISCAKSERTGAAVLASFGMAAGSLIVQFIDIANEVYTGDFSALLDTMQALIVVIVLYIALTLLLNIVMVRKARKDDKRRRIETMIMLIVFLGVMAVLLFMMGTIFMEVLRFRG